MSRSLFLRLLVLVSMVFLVGATAGAVTGCGDDEDEVTAGTDADVDDASATTDGDDSAESDDAVESDDDERLDPYDSGGATPEDIVEEYLLAIQEGDWEQAYELQVEEDRPDLDLYTQERSEEWGELEEFVISERRMLNTAEAQVAVATTVLQGGGASRVETEQWWNVVKEHGYWRIPLDPVQ